MSVNVFVYFSDAMSTGEEEYKGIFPGGERYDVAAGKSLSRLSLALSLYFLS
jgi:hypothetical protein